MTDFLPPDLPEQVYPIQVGSYGMSLARLCGLIELPNSGSSGCGIGVGQFRPTASMVHRVLGFADSFSRKRGSRPMELWVPQLGPRPSDLTTWLRPNLALVAQPGSTPEDWTS